MAGIAGGFGGTFTSPVLGTIIVSELAPTPRKKYVEAIKRASEWLLTVPREALRQPDLLAIRFRYARPKILQQNASVRNR